MGDDLWPFAMRRKKRFNLLKKMIFASLIGALLASMACVGCEQAQPQAAPAPKAGPPPTHRAAKSAAEGTPAESPPKAEHERGFRAAQFSPPLCEASAAARLGEERVLVADNELDDRLFAFDIHKGSLIGQQSLGFSDEHSPKDIEALSWAGEELVVVGSGSHNKDCEPKPKRARLSWLRWSDDGLSLQGTMDFGESLEAAAASVEACRALALDSDLPLLDRFCKALHQGHVEASEAHCGEWNAEGAFYDEERALLWLGLRSPLVEEAAVLVALAWPSQELRWSQFSLLDLEGYGVRELSLEGDTLYGLAGPMLDADEAHRLFRVSLAAVSQSGSKPLAVTWLGEVPTSAEGLVVEDGGFIVLMDGAEGETEQRCDRYATQIYVER